MDHLWTAYIYSQDYTVEHAYNKKVVSNAKNCNKALKGAIKFINEHSWELVSSADEQKIYSRVNFDGQWEYKTCHADYEIFITEDTEKTLWNVSIYPKNNNIAIAVCEKIIINAPNYDEAIQMVKEFLTNEWKFVASYDMFKVYIRKNMDHCFDCKITKDDTVIEMKRSFEDEECLALARAVGMADKHYKKHNHQV
jgi:hypothetical protein